MNAVLPWQQEQWQNLMIRLRATTLPHALLLAGPGGLGKNRFASLLVQTLLCEAATTSGMACGVCRSCLLYAADSHPDLRIIRPLEAGKVITVDQVREAGQYLNQTSQYGGYKALIITPADQMNANASNSLLKTLEEPSAWSFILLVTDRPGHVPATVLSRCQRMEFTPPKPQEAREWLREHVGSRAEPGLLLDLAEGAPLRALQFIEDDVMSMRLQVAKGLKSLAQGKGNYSSIAEQFLKIGAKETLYWMYYWTADIIRFLCGGGESSMANKDLREYLVPIAQNAELQSAHNYLRYLNDALQLVDRQLNPLLLLENILMSWQEMLLRRR